MQKADNLEVIPVSYYELLGISKTDESQIIKQKYRLLYLLLHPDAAQKWAEPDDLTYFKEIVNKITDAYEVLSDPQKRSQYNATLKLQITTPAERDFRGIWNGIRTKYHDHFSKLRLTAQSSDQQPAVAGRWPWPRDVLFSICKRLQSRELGRVARVDHTADRCVIEVALQDYCDFINQQRSIFVKPDENPLTLTKLREHWQHGDQQLRRLIACRFYPVNSSLKLWSKTFLRTAWNSAQNSYLNNPYLRDLIIAVSVQHEVGAEQLLVVTATRLNDFHDPSAIALYLKATYCSLYVSTELREDYQNIKNLFRAYVIHRLPHLKMDIEKLLWPRGRVGNISIDNVKSYVVQDIVVASALSLYCQPDKTVSFLCKPYQNYNFNHNQIGQFYGMAISHCSSIPSRNFQNWLLSLDTEFLTKLFDKLTRIRHHHFDEEFWEDLYTQVVTMSPQEILVYLDVMCDTINVTTTNVDDDSELDDNNEGQKPEINKKWRLVANQRLIQRQKEYAKLPVESIKDKLSKVPDDISIGRHFLSYFLRLLLNKRLRYNTPQLLLSIFNIDEDDDLACPKNIKKFETYVTDDCINFLTDPNNPLDDGSSKSSVVGYLASQKVDQAALAKIIDLCITICEQDALHLLTDRVIFLSELLQLPKDFVADFLVLAKTISSSRQHVLRLLQKTRYIPVQAYRGYLEQNSIAVNSLLELTKFIITPVETVLSSVCCLVLLQRLGLENFNRFSALSFIVPLIIYTEGLCNSHPEHFPGLLSIIVAAFQNNEENQLPYLINAYLQRLQPTLCQSGLKRTLPDDPERTRQNGLN